MKRTLQFATLTWVAAIVGLFGLTVGRAAALDQPVTILTADNPDDVQTHVDAIEHAPDPSAAVAAYAAAKSALPDSSRVDQAYVRRMVAFGLPQMAEAQAQTLVQRDPKDGLAWGVMAYSRAKRGQTADALKDIASAARYLPDDPFVQRTAGQLLAWYDTVADKSTLPDAIKNSVQVVRNEMASQRAYVNAYQAARSTYEQEANPAEVGPANAAGNPEEAPPIAAGEPTYGGGDAYNNYDYGYNYGAEPYTFGTVPYVYPYAYPYPAYPDYFPYRGGYYGGYFWPGPFSSVIVPGGGFFFRSRFFHREPDLDDFVGFPGHRFSGHRFFDRNEHVFGRHLGGFDRRHFGDFGQRRGLVSRAPRFNRGFATHSPPTTRAPHFAPTPPRTRAPRHFTPAPHMSRGPQFTHSAPRMAAPAYAAPRFAAAPHFGGGGHMGRGGGHRR